MLRAYYESQPVSNVQGMWGQERQTKSYSALNAHSDLKTWWYFWAVFKNMCTWKRVTLVEKEKLEQYTIRQHHKYHTVCLSYCSCRRDKNTLTKPPNGGRIYFSSQFQRAVMVGNQGYRVSKQLDAPSQETAGCVCISFHLTVLILYSPWSLLKERSQAQFKGVISHKSAQSVWFPRGLIFLVNKVCQVDNSLWSRCLWYFFPSNSPSVYEAVG